MLSSKKHTIEFNCTASNQYPDLRVPSCMHDK